MQHLVKGESSDPGLNAKPAAGYDGPEHGWYIRAPDAETGPGKNRKGNSISGAGPAVQNHGDQYDGIAQEDRGDRFPPVHPSSDQGTGQHIRRDAKAHADP